MIKIKLLKAIIFCLMLLLSYRCYSQDGIHLPNVFSLNFNIDDCGHWEIGAITIGEWFNQDTIKYNPKGDTNWVYTEWMNINNNYTYAIYCPCGCRENSVRYMERVNDIGIVQRRNEVTTYKYIPKPKTQFQNKIDSLKNH